ncbi:hypothetical protein GALL_243380 [mine drainage metagenome]|uniref:Uncharacterized protein n=1 Tax=mine drainage metagenome TaxID=410659 RepID=A0A1J5REF7_9ZZZZ
MKIARIAVFVIAATIASNAWASPTVDAKLKKAIEEAMGEKLSDPYSAKYTYDRVRKEDARTGVVCGTVNAKNRFGAYVGKTVFVAIYAKATDGGYMTTPDTMDGISISDHILDKMCGP